MHNKRCLRPSLALGGLTAAVALLAGLPQANAQAPAPAPALSGAGSFPQSFIVPGTNTSLHVGGQIQIDLDTGFDSAGSGTSVGAYDNLAPATVAIGGAGASESIGGHNNSHTTRFTADNSKLFTETRTPSAYGEIKTYLEFDFQGGQFNQAASSGGSTTIKCCADDGIPRLRMAYGTLGPWLIGKAPSNFSDLAALSDTFEGFTGAGQFMGAGTFRQTQIRYTWLLPNGISAAASIENADSGGFIQTNTVVPGAALAFTGSGGWNDFNAPGFTTVIPAVVGNVRIAQPWGHAQLALAVMQERFENTAASGSAGAAYANFPGGTHFERWGYMLTQTGHYNTWGKDKVTWAIGYGQGAAQYSWPLSSPDLGLNTEEGMICSGQSGAAGAAATKFACSEPRVFGVTAGYSHFWTDEWRSGVDFGYDTVSRPNAAGGWDTASLATGPAALTKLEKTHYSAGASLYWTPVDSVQFGLGYLWFHRVVWSGAHGSAQRLLSQAIFRF